MTISANVTAASITATASSWRPSAALSGAGVTAAVASKALPTVPGAPTNLANDLSTSTVYFDAPSDGGSPITEYRLYVSNTAEGSQTLAESTRLSGGPFEYDGDTYDAGLTAGTAANYAAVSAVNAVGEGPKSAPILVSWI